MSLERPDFNSYADKVLYDNLLCKNSEELNEVEKDFIKTMYHFEEFACGLDGDIY